jgi:molybdate transport system substrate-binding protein
MKFATFKYAFSAIIILCASITQAAEIKVLTAGAFKPAISAVAEAFEKQTGHTVKVENDTAGALLRRISGGEAFDLAIITPGALDELGKTNRVSPASITRLARVAIGVAVKKGAPAPDIRTVEAFKTALINARAVAYIDPQAGGSSGIYLTGLFEKLGIADRIKPKAVLVPEGLVAERLINDQADITLHQISEILAVPAAQLVGPIPAEIQNYTVYAGALSSTVRDATATQALLTALKSEAARETMKKLGLEVQ